jgi:hypothetical protein
MMDEKPATARFRLALGVALLVAGLAPPAWQLARPRLAEPFAMRLIGERELTAGGPAGFRVVCVDPLSGAPRAGIGVEVGLVQGTARKAEARHVTDAGGEALATLQVPGDLEGEMELVVAGRGGTWLVPDTDVLRQTVRVARRHSLLLSTDKPFYQPGQTIHMRVLALARPGLVPIAGSPLAFLVIDAKGNKVFKKEVRVDEFGVAAASFAIAEVVNEGEYKVRVEPAGRSGTRRGPGAGGADAPDEGTEKTVTVKPYVLPKFKVEVEPDRPFYRPGETVTARVRAAYFFGKPVRGQAEVELSTFQAGITPVGRTEVSLSAEGRAQAAMALPRVLTGLETEGGRGLLFLRAKVTDSAGHTQEVHRTLPVSAAPVIVEAIPEAGRLVEGLENIVYLTVARPDGTPLAGARLSVSPAGLTATTDAAGLAEVRLVPREAAAIWTIDVRDATGMREVVTVKLREAGARATLREPLQLAVYREDATDGGALVRAMTSRVKDGTPVSTRIRVLALGASSLSWGWQHELALASVPPWLEFEVEDETGGRKVFRKEMSVSAPPLDRTRRGRRSAAESWPGSSCAG